MRDTLTISLPVEMRRSVGRSAKAQHMTASEYVRDALRRRLAVERFHAVRARVLPKAQAQGIHTDEDVFKLTA